MKNLTLATTLLALTAATATPSFATGENPIAESRAIIERALEAERGVTFGQDAPTIRSTSFSTQSATSLNKYDAVIDRLFGSRSGPSGR